MNTQHTPSPWTIDDTQRYYPKSCIRHNGVIVCHLPTLANSLGDARLEDEANARLIAAAPDLLAALREHGLIYTDAQLAQLATATSRRGEIAPEAAAREIRRRAAIAKAEGSAEA